MLGELTENIEYRELEDEEGGSADDAPVIRYVTQIIQNAMDSNASDIHVEPMADRLRIRYRIDGLCFAMDPAPKRLQGPVIQRIKIGRDAGRRTSTPAGWADQGPDRGQGYRSARKLSSRRLR